MTPEEKAQAIQKALDSKIEDLNKAYQEADKIKGEELSNQLSEKAKELSGEIKELHTKYEEAQKALEGNQKEIDELKGEIEKAGSFGEEINPYKKSLKENEEAVKAMSNKAMGKRAEMTLKTEDFFRKDTMTTGASLGTRRVIPFDRVIQTPVFDPEETALRQYFNVASTSADSVEWPIEQVPNSSPLESYDFDNQAGSPDSDAAAAKAESEFQWDLETRTVRDVAHLVRLHKNLMNDLALLETYLPNRLRDGLLREESRQILRGADGSNEIIGLSQTGSHVDFDIAGFQAAVVNNNKTVANANFIDILGFAKTQLRLNNYVASRILMNPEDFYSLMFVVNDDGDYLMNTPNWQYVANLIVQSNYVNQDEFYVFDSRANTIFQRENINVEFSYEDRDNFQKNLVTIRAEERIVQVTDRPNGIVLGSFEDAVGS